MVCGYVFGGGGGSRTRVRWHYIYDSTCLDSVFGFSPHRSDSQDGLDDLLKVSLEASQRYFKLASVRSHRGEQPDQRQSVPSQAALRLLVRKFRRLRLF